MTDATPLTTQRMFTSLRYVDAHAGIAFLERAFGFTRHAVYDDGAGGVAHAQLVFQGQIVMLSSSREGPYPVKSPREVGGVVTAGVSISMDDPAEVDRLYERARDAGAEILMPPHDQDYGSHDFMARDPEGHVWSFGTYRPEAP